MTRLTFLALALLCSAGPAMAGRARPAVDGAAKMPIREITVFKDGHAFALHAGEMPTDAAGNVVMDYLPTPVLGTFWAYSSDRDARLVSVTGGARKVPVDRPALTVGDLVEANPGVKAVVTTTDKATYTGTIVGVTRPDLDPPLSPAPFIDPRSGYGGYGYSSGYYGGGFGGSYAAQPGLRAPPSQGQTVLLKTERGTVALPLALVKTVSFEGPCRRTVSSEEWRNRLTLKMEWPGSTPRRRAHVGLLYLQKGVRWVPSYKVAVDGGGRATVKLQATLLNEMVDLDDVTVYLVVGVPTFYFKDSPDPISLQQSFPPLSRYFQSDSQTGFAFSNAIMGQGGFGGFGGGGFGGGGGGRSDLGDDGTRLASTAEARDVPGGGEEGQEPPQDIMTADRNEDLYLFTVRHVTLKKGQSQVVPVAEVTLPYKDIYTVEIAFAPPQEVQKNTNREQEAELAKLLRTPRAQHKIRLTNTSKTPLTTAPALIVNGDRVISQSLMAWTAAGAESDLTLTTAGDIQVAKSEQDAKPPEKAEYNRRDKTGTVAVTSYAPRAVDLEVVRYVPGRVDSVDHGGKSTWLSGVDDDNYLRRDEYPYWWWWYSWPYWWYEYNGLSRVTWRLRLEPKQSESLSYTWHYFAR